MKGINSWSFNPYRPMLFETGDIYITRVCPYETHIHLEWQNPSGAEYKAVSEKYAALSTHFEQSDGYNIDVKITMAKEYDLVGEAVSELD